MLLDRIDIDSHGPLARIGLGPFSQQLNVITAPAGAGKTALVRFLRDSLTGTTPAYEGMAKSSGRVVWAAADGLYHCRREPNGTPQGRRFVEFESRLGGPAHSWNRPSVVVDLPATIVDGIVTDTTITSLRRIVQAVLRSGLDLPASRATGAGQGADDAQIAALRAEIDHLRTLLHQDGQATGARPTDEQIRARLAALTLELGAIDSRRQYARQTEAAAEQGRRDRAAISQAVEEVDRLRIQETELRKRIHQLDQTLARLQEQAKQDENRIALTQLTRTRVHWLNQQIDRLRRVLAEVRHLGDDWFGGVDTTAVRQRRAVNEVWLDQTPVDQNVIPLRREELEIADRGWLSATRPAGHSAEPLVTAEVEARLDSICQLVDHLSGRLEAEQERWIGAEHPAAEICGEAISESEQALQRLRQDAAQQHGSALQPRLAEDPGWVEDSLRRRRIDALRRAEQRRKLDETADCEQVHGRPQSAFEVTLQTIGTALQSVSRRLRVLRAQCHLGTNELLAWSSDSWPEAPATAATALPSAERAEALRRCEGELVTALQRLAQHRVSLLRRVAQAQQLPESLLEALIADAATLPATVDQWLVASLSVTPNQSLLHDGSTTSAGHDREAARQQLENQRRGAAEELERTIKRMNEKLAEAEALRTRLAPLRVQPASDEEQRQRDRIEAEIHRLHALLAARETPLLQRYRQCVRQLQMLTSREQPVSPLAELASSYLQRLSGGRLPSVSWRSTLERTSGRQQLAVLLASQPESQCSDVDRFLGGLAVRLAAADELTRRGRPLPLIIETPSRIDAFDNRAMRYDAYSPQTRIEDVVATLAEAAERGRQVILLTEDQRLANAILSAGGRGYALDNARTASRLPLPEFNHNGDSVWRSATEMDELTDAQAVVHAAGDVSETLERSPFDQPTSETAVNGQAAARAYAIPVTQRTDESASGKTARFRFNQHFTAAHGDEPVAADEGKAVYDRDVVRFPTREQHAAQGRGEGIAFFLTADSPIEQAPSVDVLAAAKLRRLGVTVVSQLLMSSPQELAAKLQLVDINAATVRRWQNECRLVCGVPGLRGFDARVLVGCGLVHPREIEEISPAELVERVETFLATPRGVQILRTGTSHEIARLTGWMAEARHLARSGDVFSHGPVGDEQGSSQSNETVAKRSRGQSVDAGWDERRGGRKGVSRTRIRRPAEVNQTENHRSAEGRSAAVLDAQASVAETDGGTTGAQTPTLKFYLHRHSPIVDAPSIGPRMAERLARLQIVNVEDLLTAKPAAVASGLKLRRVDESLVRSWQQQAKLVCRVPMLRGHDAQLLVAAGITEPERLAQCDPQWLLTQIDPISRSREGQSILRGGQAPDLAEITRWIQFAKQHRELRAA